MPLIPEKDAHQTLSVKLSSTQKTGLVILRVFIGWHFLYEGLIKWSDPEWSAAGFLTTATWILSGFYTWLAENEILLAIVDFLNQAGLFLLGIALIAGLLTRTAAVAGMILLGLYYLAHPPLFDGGTPVTTGSSYLLIDNNLIEMVALYLVYVFKAGRFSGLDALIEKWRSSAEL